MNVSIIDIDEKIKSIEDAINNNLDNDYIYVGNDTEVKIPAKINNLDVITVGAGCFEGNSKITSIRFNNKITTVRDAAFKDCTALVSIDKFKALEEIGVSAFEGCTSLKSFKLPDAVTLIPERCFENCSSLKEMLNSFNSFFKRIKGK